MTDLSRSNDRVCTDSKYMLLLDSGVYTFKLFIFFLEFVEIIYMWIIIMTIIIILLKRRVGLIRNEQRYIFFSCVAFFEREKEMRTLYHDHKWKMAYPSVFRFEMDGTNLVINFQVWWTSFCYVLLLFFFMVVFDICICNNRPAKSSLFLILCFWNDNFVVFIT